MLYLIYIGITAFCFVFLDVLLNVPLRPGQTRASDSSPLGLVKSTEITCIKNH